MGTAVKVARRERGLLGNRDKGGGFEEVVLPPDRFPCCTKMYVLRALIIKWYRIASMGKPGM